MTRAMANWRRAEPARLLLAHPGNVVGRKMLSGYLMNRDKGLAIVCGLIIADMRAHLDRGAKEKAADALLVLQLLLAKFPSLDTSAIPKFAWSNPSSGHASMQMEMAPLNRSNRLS